MITTHVCLYYDNYDALAVETFSPFLVLTVRQLFFLFIRQVACLPACLLKQTCHMFV